MLAVQNRNGSEIALEAVKPRLLTLALLNTKKDKMIIPENQPIATSFSSWKR